MTTAQYKTLKIIESSKRLLGRDLPPHCYDGRVIPGLLKTDWAVKNTDGTVKITDAGRSALKAETAERRPVLSTEEKLARLGSLGL